MASMLPQNMNVEQNMGTMDRIIRSALGGMLLMSGLRMSGSMFGRLESLIGGAFIFYGVTGYDPLLQVFKTSTKPEDPKSLINKVKPDQSVKSTSRGSIDSMAGIGV